MEGSPMWYSSDPVVKVQLDRHCELNIVQDNESMNVGTTVWESSLVMAHWLHGTSKSRSNVRELSRDSMKGKRAIELGSGCGVAGIALALLGCDVWLTDIPAVLPILKKNVKRNLRSVKPLAAEPSSIGKVKVVPLTWGKSEQVKPLQPPFDFILAADVVYLEDIVSPLLSAMESLADANSIILFGYKLRQEEAHQLLWELLPQEFSVEKIPDDEISSEPFAAGVSLYILRRKS